MTILCTSTNYFAQLLVDNSVAIEVVRPLNEMRWREWIRTWLRLFKEFINPEIVFCCGHQGDVHIRDLAAAWMFGSAVYAVVHRPLERPWSLHISNIVYGRIFSMLLTGVIAVSDEINKSCTRDFHMSPHKVSTCYNWSNPTFGIPSATERTEARQSLGIASTEVLIAFLGRLSPQKRIDALLQSFAAITPNSDFPIKLGLFGDGWKRTALTELTHTLQIEDRVCFFGWTSAPWCALAACDIFVLPSVVEGFPLALIEAMATGCACLAHPMASTELLIENGTHGVLADLSDTRSFATALQSLIACGPAARSKMGLAAAGRAASEYSRARRLPSVLAALGICAEFVPAFRLRTLEFKTGAL